MRTIKLDENVVRNIVKESDSLQDALADLYDFVLPLELSKIEKLNGFPELHTNTSLMILKIFAEKYDQTQVNMLWLNKGFSSNNQVKEGWCVMADDVCGVINTDPLVEMFAKKEIEEISNPNPDGEVL